MQRHRHPLIDWILEGKEIEKDIDLAVNIFFGVKEKATLQALERRVA